MKLLYVEWEDVFTIPEWTSLSRLEEICNQEPFTVNETGFLVAENKDYIVMATRLDGDGIPGDVVKIPKRLILKRKDLSKHV